MKSSLRAALVAPVFMAVLAAVATTASAAPVITRAEHTVAWYEAHTAERLAVLRRCQNDHSFDLNGDCMNANAADKATWGQSPASGSGSTGSHKSYDGFDDSVAALRADPMSRGMVLGFCKSNRPPPAWLCANAEQAAHGSR